MSLKFELELGSKASRIDDALNDYLPPIKLYPPLIHESMRYSVVFGGKRLRPVMLMAAAESVGEKTDKILPAACAVEVLHNYSLVHDDLPAMDNDDYRRGRPTSHKMYGEATAILTGDALLTFSFQLLVHCAQLGVDSQSTLRAVDILARAAGSMGLIGGQLVDTLSEKDNIDYDTLKYIHLHKTACLFRASMEIGAVLSGAEEDDLHALGCYGENFGLAFQIIDDILDLEGDVAKTGKPTGSDLKNRKATYPLLFGVEESRAKARDAIMEAIDSISYLGDKINFLRHLAYYVLSRDR
ncbi:MAG TPA: farnesyl diphosphate synthase [Clostridia bacterium]|nr:farnesyl diphosphate synthase [Clostridia bacterium]